MFLLMDRVGWKTLRGLRVPFHGDGAGLKFFSALGPEGGRSGEERAKEIDDGLGVSPAMTLRGLDETEQTSQAFCIVPWLPGVLVDWPLGSVLTNDSQPGQHILKRERIHQEYRTSSFSIEYI